ncbi:MAG: DUF547 domain-containing protein [Blastocatellia bacterium]
MQFSALILTTTAVLAVAACNSNATETVTAQDAVVNENKDIKGEVDHSAFEALLVKHVNENGLVDYDGFTKDKAKLEAYLATLAEVDFAALANDDERNALHINGYNAYTILAVINEVYGKNSSVKNIKGFWDKKKYRLAKRDLTLDEIEKYSRELDPRVHFAYNCASASCPRLQKFAFTGAKLQEQFDLITKDFLADTERGMLIDRDKKTIQISRLFLWYASDFKGKTSKSSQYWEIFKGQFSASVGVGFIKTKVDDETKQLFDDKKFKVSFMDYSWELNSTVPPAANLPKAPTNE